jgi:hypothetical protein
VSLVGSAVRIFWQVLPVFDAIVRRLPKRKPKPAPPSKPPPPPLGNQRTSVGGGRPPPGLRH